MPGAAGVSSRASRDSPAPATARAAAFPALITHTGHQARLWNPDLILIKTRHFHLVSHCNYSPASRGRCQRAAPHEVGPAAHPPPWQGPCAQCGVCVAVGCTPAHPAGLQGPALPWAVTQLRVTRAGWGSRVGTSLSPVLQLAPAL